MVIDTHRYTRAEASERRDVLLAEIGDIDDFEVRARDYALTVREQELRDELEDLNYILAT